MNKKFTKIIAIILAVIMGLSVISVLIYVLAAAL